MGIIKTRRVHGDFITISKEPIDSPGLSFKAKGLLTYLIGKPNDWATSVEDLIKHSTDQKSAIRSGLKELRNLGYARLTAVRKKGRIIDWNWEVSDKPIFSPDTENRNLDTKPDTENRNLVKTPKIPETPVNIEVSPDTDFQEVENRYYNNKDIKENKKEEETTNTAIPEKTQGQDSLLLLSLKSVFNESVLADLKKWRIHLTHVKLMGWCQDKDLSTPTPETILKACSEIKEKMQAGEFIRNPVGYLHNMLLNGFDGALPAAAPKYGDMDVRQAPAMVAPAVALAKDDPGVWPAALKLLEARINGPSFNTWLRPVKLLEFNGRVRLLVPNDVFQGWLSQHYRGIIAEAITAVTMQTVKQDEIVFELQTR